MKRIIWIAQDKRHKIISIWWNGCGYKLKDWKYEWRFVAEYFTKHYLEV